MENPIFLQISGDLALRQLVSDDAEELFALTDRNREHLRKWLPWLDTCPTVKESLVHIETVWRQSERGDGLSFGIRYGNRIAGTVGYNQISADRIGYIGYWIGKEYEGKGIMFACVSQLIDYGFHVLGLEKQTIAAAVENARSRSVAERLKFKLESTTPNNEWLYDHYVDHVNYSITKTEWVIPI